jgi:hypothetical protein
LALLGELKTLRLDHVFTLETFNNLGCLYQAQSRLKKALKMHKRALVGRESILDIDNITTLNIVNDLTAVYYALSKIKLGSYISEYFEVIKINLGESIIRLS